MKRILLRIAKKIIRYFEETKNTSYVATDIMEDVFKRNFKKRVLLSYIQQPFIEGIKYHHTNYLECYTAAEIFSELGYAVDVVDLFNDKVIIDYAKYEIVYGLGITLEKSFYCSNPEGIFKILYATGCNPFYSYKASLLQTQNFYNKTGKLIPESSRVSEHFWACSYLLSDHVIALGNEFVANSFIDTNHLLKCSAVNAFYFDVYDINLNNKDFEKARKHFLWFGSTGLLHKGLDLVIDIFSERQDINLHICGASKSEIKFWEYYQPILDNSKNIINHGFVNIQSDDFKILMNECAFCIFPTASEGGAPALLNVMANGGLIPIASRACGIDIEDLGFVFDKLNKDSIQTNIELALIKHYKTLQEKAGFIKESIKDKYSFNNYKKSLKQCIINALNIET